MKCPYCTDEISDQSVVCHTCRRDPGLFLPLLERLSKAESGVRLPGADLASGHGDVNPVSAEAVAITTALGLDLALSFVSYWLSWHWYAVEISPG